MRETESLYLDDLHLGQRFTSGTYLMEETRIREFAAEFDPQPFHLDEAAAEASVFRGLAASGWHTAAVAMRLLDDRSVDAYTMLGFVHFVLPTKDHRVGIDLGEVEVDAINQLLL